MQRVADLARVSLYQVLQVMQADVGSQPREAHYAKRSSGSIARDLTLECRSRKSC
jgi:hypothetical protein